MSRDDAENAGTSGSGLIERLVQAGRTDQSPHDVVSRALDRFVASAPAASPVRSRWARFAKISIVVVTGSSLWFAAREIGTRTPATVSAPSSVAPDRPATAGAPQAVLSPSIPEPVPPPIAETPPGLDVHALPTAAAPAPAHTAVSLARTDGPSATTAASARAPDASPRESDFAAELARLRAARAAIDRGEIDAARVTLADYERAFPKGVLMPEARAMGVDALLAGGRASEARRAAARFVEQYPRSPQAARMLLIAREGDAR